MYHSNVLKVNVQIHTIFLSWFRPVGARLFVAPNTSVAPSRMAPHARVGSRKSLCKKFCALSQLSCTPQKDTLMQDFGVENKTFLHTKGLCTRICILPKLFQRAKLGVQGAENPCVYEMHLQSSLHRNLNRPTDRST